MRNLLPRKDAKDHEKMRVAKADTRGRRLIVDYDLLSGSQYITLQGDTTYLVSSLVNVTDILTIEGGTVVKYSNGGEISVAGSTSNIVCQTGPYRPGVFTSVYDSTVGSSISNGTPTVGNTYLSFTLPGTQPLTLRYLRFSYASTAIAGAISAVTGATDWIKVWDCQFFDCSTGIASTPNETTSLYLYNVLFSSVNYGLSTGTSNGSLVVGAVNVTGDAMNTFAYNINGANVSATNCLFTAVTNMPWVSLWTDCRSNLNGSAVYTNVGAAGYYLVNGSSYRGLGTTAIDAGLLADLGTLTTYQPAILPTYITTSTNLGPQAPRNTGTPDLGYHYSPLDYAANSIISNATVTVSNGTVIAGYGGSGLQLWGTTAGLNFNGNAISPCYFVRYNTVQEQSNTSWESGNWDGCLETGLQTTQTAAVFDFTDWCVLAGDYLIFYGTQGDASVSTAQNCQFYSGQISQSGQTIVSVSGGLKMG